MIFGISLAAHAYIAVRLIPALSGWPALLIVLGVLLPMSAVLVPTGLLIRRHEMAGGTRTLSWVGMLMMGVFSSLFVLTLLRDVGLLLAWGAHGGNPGAGWGRWRMNSAAFVPIAAFVVTGVGFLNARRTARIVDIDIPIASLPAALEGFTIAQISDIHVGPTIREPYVSAIVAAVNRLQPDLVAVTGDLVDGRVTDLAPHVAPLADLRSAYGTFFVTGNHEYYSGAQPWIDELRRLGLTVLLDEHVVLRRGDASIVVAGVTDFSAAHFIASHRSDPAQALSGAPAEAAVKLLLAHQPRSAPAAEAAGFDLQLSGHTHGGQFLPWTFFVKLQQPFVAGLRRLGRLWVYTSRGTGYWGPPKRFGAPSEITRIRLVADPAAARRSAEAGSDAGYGAKFTTGSAA